MALPVPVRSVRADRPAQVPAMLLWALLFLGLPAFVASLSPGRHPLALQGQAATAGAGATFRPPSPPPPVEPLRVLEIAPETAREINAAVPFSTDPNPAARPFTFAGSDTARSRAVDCLAAAQLYEAGDTATGQKAVAQVVLNRLRHPAFPKTVCGVVFQGSERTTGCQFTFACDGALGRAPSPAAWDRARDLARHMLSGTIDRRVGYATHYHTDWVVPYWSSSLDKITAVGTHLFFRWKGWWGTPPAFRGRDLGEEPAEAKLAFLSPAHAAAGSDAAVLDPLAPPGTPSFPDLARPALAIGRERIGDRFGPGQLTAVNSGGDAFVMLLDRRADPAAFETLARQMCGGRTKCRLLGWTRVNDTPNRFPIDQATLDTMSYAYIRATDSGLERSLYNCREFKGQPRDHCMRDRTPAPATAAASPPPGAATATPAPARTGTEVVRLPAAPQ